MSNCYRSGSTHEWFSWEKASYSFSYSGDNHSLNLLCRKSASWLLGRHEIRFLEERRDGANLASRQPPIGDMLVANSVERTVYRCIHTRRRGLRLLDSTTVVRRNVMFLFSRSDLYEI